MSGALEEPLFGATRYASAFDLLETTSQMVQALADCADMISLSSKDLNVGILRHGATLASVRFPKSERNMVLGFAQPPDHQLASTYAGAIVGPVANRVSGGTVIIDGTNYQMEQNEKGITALHSGADGLHAKIWSVQAQTQSMVTLTTTLDDMACGLPGTRKFTASYEVSAATLRLEITATTDHPTPINIAAHPYWSLDGHSQINHHELSIAATHYTPVDAQNIPTGDVTAVTGTLFDFTSPKRVPLDPALDVNFCLSDAERLAPMPAARLTGTDGTQLDIATTAPGLQIYNGAHLPDIPGARDDGFDLRRFGGLAIEPQFWPDAPNSASFPQITLEPGRTWRQITTYTLSKPE